MNSYQRDRNTVEINVRLEYSFRVAKSLLCYQCHQYISCVLSGSLFIKSKYMPVVFHAQDCDFKLQGRRRAAAWLRAAAMEEGRRVGEVSVVFTSAARLLEINRRYLGHDYRTDIVTFDYGEEVLSGDLMIDVETVDGNAAAYGVAFEEELRRVMVHGVLHLCGYKDKTPEEQSVMRAKENYYMARY
jgi:rRNA maturation RNase YbeY